MKHRHVEEDKIQKGESYEEMCAELHAIICTDIVWRYAAITTRAASSKQHGNVSQVVFIQGTNYICAHLSLLTNIS